MSSKNISLLKNKNTAFITLGADVGGRDAYDATHAHILALRKLLNDYCTGSYSETIKQIALVLRIDGSVQTWGKQGVEHVALQKKGTLATADIYVPLDVWASGHSDFRNFLASEVKVAIAEIAECARQQGVDLLRADLEHDVLEATSNYASK